MSIRIKRATLWSIETPNKPGTLAATLGPLADAAADLQLVMGYSQPDKVRSTIEVYPVDSVRAQRAARSAGFRRSSYPCVAVSGHNRPGLGRDIAAALAEAGININFFVAQVVGSRYTGMFSFEAHSEADLAVRILRRAMRNSARGARGGVPRSRPKRRRS